VDQVDRGTMRAWQISELAALPSTYFTSAADRWKALPRTRERLQSGKPLRIVMLGDSIINDTFGGGLELMMSSQWPNANLSVIPSVRSATGVGYYQEKGRVKDYVIDLEPDLVIIGGVSHGYDLEATRSVVRQIQAASDAEILMLTGAMAPEDMFRMSMRRQTGLSPLKAAARVRAFNRGLPELASEMGAGFFDMRRVWDAYIYDSGLFSNCYHRDAVHGNITGKLLLASILARYLGQ